MSLKKQNQNDSAKYCTDYQQWTKLSSGGDTNVIFACEDAKDRLYEPKHKKKLVRVLTVVAYIFFVSFAAIMLSLYYVFLWNGNQKESNVRVVNRAMTVIPKRCAVYIGELKDSLPVAAIREETTIPSTPLLNSKENTTDFYEDFGVDTIYVKKGGSTFLKKLIRNKMF